MEIVPKMCGRKISIYSIGLWWERKGEVYNICCYMPGNVFPTARTFIDYFEDTWHLILNETVSRQNLWEGNIAKYKTSEGNCALLQRGLVNSPLQNVPPREKLRLLSICSILFLPFFRYTFLLRHFLNNYLFLCCLVWRWINEGW